MKLANKNSLTTLISILVFDIIYRFVAIDTYMSIDFGAGGFNPLSIVLNFSITHLIVLLVPIFIILWINKDIFYLKFAITRVFILTSIIPLSLAFSLRLFGFINSSDITPPSLVDSLMSLVILTSKWLPLIFDALLVVLIIFREKGKLKVE